MQIIRLNEVSGTSLSIRFKQSTLAHLIATLIITGLIIGAVYWHITDAKEFSLGVLISCCLLLSIPALLSFSCFKKSLAPSNWILLISPNQVLVKFRSYMNLNLSEDDPQVVQFHPSEIEFARMTKQKLTSWGQKNSKRTSFYTYLDLSIMKHDLTSLKDQIKYERNLKAPQKGRFIKHRSRYKHYPVSVVDNRIIRIEWWAPGSIVTPGVKKALAKLSEEGIKIETLHKEVIDLTRNKDDQKQAEDNILYLAERGDSLAAARQARKTYNLSLKEAKDFVEDLIK